MRNPNTARTPFVRPLSPFNRYIEDLVSKAVAATNQPAWLWRNVLRWRWNFVRANAVRYPNAEAFMEASIPSIPSFPVMVLN